MADEEHPTVEDLIPIRSLWTNVRTGSQIIVTGLSSDGDWVNKLMVGSMGHGGCKVSHLLNNYVMASETCDISVRPH